MAIAASVIALVPAGCGGGGGGKDGDSGGAAGPVHVHGLGVNPRDGALFIATHTGLFRAAKGEKRARRVGKQSQDTMGFTVVGPDRFLGSGHPAPGEDRPPNLGLIESRTAGRSWREISLSGEADFHVLRFAHGRVYAYDASGGRVMLSRDRGRTWSERRAPAALLDLTADPGNSRRFVASGEGGTYRSQDEGRAWRRLDRQIGFLAWPAPARLVRIDARGRVARSRDGGGSWAQIGEIGGQPAALLARSSSELYSALADGTVLRSADGGRSWALRSKP